MDNYWVNVSISNCKQLLLQWEVAMQCRNYAISGFFEDTLELELSKLGRRLAGGLS